ILEEKRLALFKLMVELKERKDFFISYRMYIDDLLSRLIHNFRVYFMDRRQRVLSLTQRLSDLNPHNILKRGFSIAIKKETKEVIINSQKVQRGEGVSIILHKGQLECIVEESIN
ncbi:MAG: hypothetical protein N2596_09215, partial [Syntrophorhabdaceae bacterium]|nr:hypothetical protein [Syntrophorhabdaceae bacterium]